MTDSQSILVKWLSSFYINTGNWYTWESVSRYSLLNRYNRFIAIIFNLLAMSPSNSLWRGLETD